MLYIGATKSVFIVQTKGITSHIVCLHIFYLCICIQRVLIPHQRASSVGLMSLCKASQRLLQASATRRGKQARALLISTVLQFLHQVSHCSSHSFQELLCIRLDHSSCLQCPHTGAFMITQIRQEKGDLKIGNLKRKLDNPGPYRTSDSAGQYIKERPLTGITCSECL